MTHIAATCPQCHLPIVGESTTCARCSQPLPAGTGVIAPPGHEQAGRPVCPACLNVCVHHGVGPSETK
jgi:hypothetical protein